jgi:hypothetical protein
MQLRTGSAETGTAQQVIAPKRECTELQARRAAVAARSDIRRLTGVTLRVTERGPVAPLGAAEEASCESRVTVCGPVPYPSSSVGTQADCTEPPHSEPLSGQDRARLRKRGPRQVCRVGSREAASLASVWSRVLWCARAAMSSPFVPYVTRRGEQLKCVAQCASPLSGRRLVFLAHVGAGGRRERLAGQ